MALKPFLSVCLALTLSGVRVGPPAVRSHPLPSSPSPSKENSPKAAANLFACAKSMRALQVAVVAAVAVGVSFPVLVHGGKNSQTRETVLM